MDKKDAWGSLSDDLIFVGITGGIASGKSEFAAEIKSLGGFIIDADEIGRELLKPGRPLNKKIAEVFCESVVVEDGVIDRGKLAEIVFSDPPARNKLDEITHPVIFDEMVKMAVAYNEQRGQEPPLVFVDAPLIVDTGIAGIFDVLIVIVSDEESRVERLVEYKGYSVGEARKRIMSQVSDTQRLNCADIIIENDGELADLKQKARDLWRELAKRAVTS